MVDRDGKFVAQALRFEQIITGPTWDDKEHRAVYGRSLAVTRPERAYDTREEAEAHTWD